MDYDYHKIMKYLDKKIAEHLKLLHRKNNMPYTDPTMISTYLITPKIVYRTRRLVKSEDLNGAGTLFGGKALAWIDEEAAIFASCQLSSKNLVTKLISEVNFVSPAYMGDILEIGCDLIKIGETSITVSCTIRNKSTQHEIVKVDKIVFVNIDPETKKAKPHGIQKYG